MALKNTIKHSSYLLLLLLSNLSFAQQDALFTNYMYNTNIFNPAYTGTREVISVYGMHRSQWAGLEGAPSTSVFSFQSPLNSNLSFGINFINDQVGPSDENNLSIDIAYKFLVSETNFISFGVKTTANLFNVDYRKLNIEDGTDIEFQNNVDNRFSPNFGAGVYWYSEKHYLGLSIPNFLETEYYDGASTSLAKQRMHYYLMGGYVFDVHENIKLKPAFLAKLITGAPVQFDTTLNLLFYEKLTLGSAYRWNASWSGLVGFQISDSLFIGYSYDADNSRLANYNSGSHEIFIRFEFLSQYTKMLSPRFF
jgi:type IX secretion system PorP/SprF family membrane protein